MDPAALVTGYGSPLYVYRLEAVREALDDLRHALPGPTALYYSLKANPHPVLARELRLGGCLAEISSPGELSAAVEAGFAGKDCLYTGPAKTEHEIALAVVAGVRRFSVESPADYRRVGRVAAQHRVTAGCLARVTTAAVGPSGLRMGAGASPSQFGTSAAELASAPDRFAAIEGARVIGMHFFPVSNACDEDALLAEFTHSIRTAAELSERAGIPVSAVDLGGGFAAPYARSGQRPVYTRLSTVLAAELDARLPGWRHGHPEIAFESGRYLAAECGTLVCTVAEVKQNSGTTFVLLDSGINHLGGMSGLGRLLRPSVTPEPLHGPSPEKDAQRVAVTGPLCTPADMLGHNVPGGGLAGGDLVTIPNVGAYGLTASLLGFLSRPMPAEVVVKDGRVVSASQLELSRRPAPCAGSPTGECPSPEMKQRSS
jgi:diaminopimelate decarboxylase